MWGFDALVCPRGAAVNGFDYCTIISGHPTRILVGKPYALKVVIKRCTYFFPGGASVDGHDDIFTFGRNVSVGGIREMNAGIIIARTGHFDFSPGSSAIVCADQVSVVGTDETGRFIQKKHIVEVSGRNSESDYIPGISAVGGFYERSVGSAGKSECGIHKMDCRQWVWSGLSLYLPAHAGIRTFKNQSAAGGSKTGSCVNKEQITYFVTLRQRIQPLPLSKSKNGQQSD